MSNQPKWAWWVVGIVIPVVGIIVSIQLASKSDSGDKSDAGGLSQSASSGASASGGSESKPPASAAADGPAKVFAGPVKITLTEGSSYVDLDNSKPFPGPSDKGADVGTGFMLPTQDLYPPKSGNVMAVSSPDGPEPTKADCVSLIKKNGTYTSGELTTGTRLCLQTNEGRIAYLRVTAVPTRKALMFEATVWE